MSEMNENRLQHLHEKWESQNDFWEKNCKKQLHEIFTLEVVQHIMKCTFHQQFTSNSLEKVIAFVQKDIENLFLKTVQYSNSIVLLEDVVRALQLDGLKLFGFEDHMYKIGDRSYYITEILTLFSTKEDSKLGMDLVQNVVSNKASIRLPESTIDATEESAESEELDTEEDDSDVEEKSGDESTLATLMDQVEECQGLKMDQDKSEETMMLDLQAAQDGVDEYVKEMEGEETNEYLLGEENYEMKMEGEWEAYTHESTDQVYYELEESNMEETNLMSSSVFEDVLRASVLENCQPWGRKITSAALSAMHDIVTGRLYDALTNGTLGWQVTNDALQFRFQDCLSTQEKLTREKGVLELQNKNQQNEIDELNRKLKAIQKNIDLGEQPQGSSDDVQKENNAPSTSFQLLKRKASITFTSKSKRTKIVPC